jgi:hypothetical protein
MTPFFAQTEMLGDKIIMFSLIKVDDLRAREREVKGTTNSAPITMTKEVF